MELSVNQNHTWVLTYDRADGLKNVVFHTFEHKPSDEEISRAAEALSIKRGYNIKPMLWG